MIITEPCRASLPSFQISLKMSSSSLGKVTVEYMHRPSACAWPLELPKSTSRWGASCKLIFSLRCFANLHHQLLSISTVHQKVLFYLPAFILSEYIFVFRALQWEMVSAALRSMTNLWSTLVTTTASLEKSKWHFVVEEAFFAMRKYV